MKHEKLRNIDEPAYQLEKNQYLNWFLANNWRIQLGEHNDREYITLVKETMDNTLNPSAIAAANELCALEIQVEKLSEMTYLFKIITNMQLEAYC